MWNEIENGPGEQFGDLNPHIGFHSHGFLACPQGFPLTRENQTYASTWQYTIAFGLHMKPTPWQNAVDMQFLLRHNHFNHDTAILIDSNARTFKPAISPVLITLSTDLTRYGQSLTKALCNQELVPLPRRYTCRCIFHKKCSAIALTSPLRLHISQLYISPLRQHI